MYALDIWKKINNNFITVVVISPLFFISIQYKIIKEITMKTITKKYPNNITVTITYNNEPSADAIKNYAQKLKKTIDSKNIQS